jgi:hypothetical protein
MITATGILLQLKVGHEKARPVPAEVVRALRSLEVSYEKSGSMSFAVTFAAGRASLDDALDYDLLKPDLLRPFRRVRAVLDIGGRPAPVLDGVITDIQLNPSNQPGASTLTVMGEDASAVMGLEEKAVAHPGLNDSEIVDKILKRYQDRVQRQVAPAVIRRAANSSRAAVQLGSDLAFVRKLARRNGYVFHIVPGRGRPVAYWGPPQRLGPAQPALSVALGAATNVERLDFELDALAPYRIEGWIQDPDAGLGEQPLTQVKVERGADIPLTRKQIWAVRDGEISLRRLVDSGVPVGEGLARAQARVTQSGRDAVSAAGELDTVRYGHLLAPYQPIGVRGAGSSYDGTYYVNSVKHLIAPGSYRQRFTLAREGTGALAPTVRP